MRCRRVSVADIGRSVRAKPTVKHTVGLLRRSRFGTEGRRDRLFVAEDRWMFPSMGCCGPPAQVAGLRCDNVGSQ